MRRLIIVILLVLLFTHTHPLRVHAADNMCNVNPGSCSTPDQWVTGWYAARRPENINAVPQQPEYTQRNESNDGNQAPDRPVEIIRLAGEPNSVNRSDIAAKDAERRGGDPINGKRTHDKINLDKNLQPVQTGSSTFDRSGVWGEFGRACQGSSGKDAKIGDASGTCTGTDMVIHACSPSQIKNVRTAKDVPNDANPGRGLVCDTAAVDVKSGTIDCIAEANARCAFIQIDVGSGAGRSAITCYPTNCAAPAASAPAPAAASQPQQPSSGESAQSEAPPPPDNPPPDNPLPTATPTETPTPTATLTPTPVPPGGTCEAIKVYDANNNDITAVIKNGSRKLTTGESIILATPKGQATKARFRIQGIADWTENDTTKTTDTEYRLEFQIPTTMTQAQGTFEVEVFVSGVWK